MAISGHVKVQPEELLSAAELAHSLIVDCGARLDRIANTMAATDGFWQGEAGDAARDVCKSTVKDVRSALDELQEYPKDLLSFESLYSDAIAKTEGLVEKMTDYAATFGGR